MPWIIMADSKMVVAGRAGMPSTSSGIMPLPVVALFAVSGPARPATAPLPKSSGCLEIRRSTAYETNVEMTCETPGMMPKMNPIRVPRPIGAAESLSSRAVGSRLRNVGMIGLIVDSLSTLSRISLTPNRPSASAVKLMPLLSSIMPNENLGTAVMKSMPIEAISSPAQTIIPALTRDPPVTTVTTTSASVISRNSAAGPTDSMTEASGGANSMSPMTLTVPPTKLPIAAIASAPPARPLRAIS